jgi:asparagine synthase (glutamine-hydrolysing)
VCGFLGKVSFENIDDKDVDGFNDFTVCRGPDETKYLTNKNFSENSNYSFSLIFNRLKILDLSNLASQPMVSKDFKNILMFNGEIFNHQELRKDMENVGIEFDTDHSDTEVILKGISNFGIDYISKLNGQFSISFFDLENDIIYLIRDRLGQKPLFYSFDDHNLSFGSNLKSVSGISKNVKIDSSEIGNFLNLGVVPSPKTILKNIYKVSPGEYLKINLKNKKIEIEKENYWNLDNFIDEKDFIDSEMIDILKSSVEIRMQADVEIANYLSGGIDSTSLIKIASKDRHLNTYSMSIEDEAYDESKWFNEVSQKFKTNNKIIRLNSKNIQFDEVIESINIFDEPYADPSTIPSFILSKEISRNFKVAISGDGGDELFGGYERIKVAHKEKSMRNNLFSKFYYLYPSFLGSGNKFLKNSNKANQSYKSYIEDKKFINLTNKKPNISFDKSYLSNSKDSIKNLLIADIKIYLSEMMLLKIDRTSMANSLEVRSPFLDHRLFEYMLSHKFTSKDLINSKRLLKKFLSEDFDENFLNRRKMGFVFDLENWIYNNKKNIVNTVYKSEIRNTISKTNINLLFLFKTRINALRIWKIFFLAVYSENVNYK